MGLMATKTNKRYNHQEDGDHNDNKDEESTSEANKEEEEEKVATIMLGNHMPALECLT